MWNVQIIDDPRKQITCHDMNLVVVTDIFSLPNAENCISTKLPNISSIRRFALNELCGKPNLSGEALHQHLFAETGLDRAIKSLSGLDAKDTIGLGYSAGGTALWRAASRGLPLKGLFCISSTRLRHEERIPIPNHVFFGEEDSGRPSDTWFASVPAKYSTFKRSKHNFYLSSEADEVVEMCLRISCDMCQIPLTAGCPPP